MLKTHDSSVNVDIENIHHIHVGDNVLINVEASGNGTVTLVVLGTNYEMNYTVNLKNGKGQVLTYNDMVDRHIFH